MFGSYCIRLKKSQTMLITASVGRWFIIHIIIEGNFLPTCKVIIFFFKLEKIFVYNAAFIAGTI